LEILLKNTHGKRFNQEQLNSIFYFMTMFIITAGLSFRTIENKYFKLLVTVFFKVQFSWRLVGVGGKLENLSLNLPKKRKRISKRN
jgi:3-methyladenine DNA glycosylase Tag